MVNILANTALAITLCNGAASSGASDQTQAKPTGESVQEVLARRHGGHPQAAQPPGGHSKTAETGGHAWTYSGANGPDHWASLSPDYAMCGKGKNQSPINVTAGIEAGLEPLAFRYQLQDCTLENNGHTIQANIPAGNAVDLAAAGFELKQFHFHSPAEHQIQGQEFPMELHFVHADSQSQLLVVAELFEFGERNPAIQTLWESMPTDQASKPGMKINPGDYLPDDRSYYRVNGSLTTPPCSEGVQWHILKHTASVSATQVERLRAVLKQANNRPLQAINARVVIR